MGRLSFIFSLIISAKGARKVDTSVRPAAIAEHSAALQVDPDPPETRILSGFTPQGGFDFPAFLKPSELNLFDVGHITKTSSARWNSQRVRSSTIENLAVQVAASVEAEESSPAFEVAAQTSMNVDSLSEKRKTFMQHADLFEQYEIHLGTDTPKNYLTQEAKHNLKKWSADTIVNKYGEFYASRLWLGGIFTRVVVTEMFENDVDVNSASEVSGGKDAGLAEMSGTVAGSLQTKVNLQGKKQYSLANAFGGDPTKMFGVDPADEDAVNASRALWQTTFNDSNLREVRFQLFPLNELIWELYPDKSSEIKEELEKRWRERNVFPELKASPGMTKYCVGHAYNLGAYYGMVSKSGLGSIDRKNFDNGRFCWLAFDTEQKDETSGLVTTQKICQGRGMNGCLFTTPMDVACAREYSAVTKDGYEFDWADEDRFCFYGWKDGVKGFNQPSQSHEYCFHQDSYRKYSQVTDSQLPDFSRATKWTNNQFCFWGFEAEGEE